MLFATCALLLLEILPGARAARAAAVAPAISAPEAIVVDGWTGAVLYARNPDVMRYPASTVKIMTALVIIDRHVPLGRVVTVGYDAATIGGSTAGLYQGETLTVKNLMYGMLLPSGNDAAYALADAIGGTSANFVAMMNAEAQHLHLWHTHYLSPNGFDMYGQVSTARDLSTLARVAMTRPFFARVVRTRSWHAWSTDHRILHHWTNLNQLLWASPYVDGVKTGTTNGAGACLVSSARKGATWVIEVNMGSSEATRFSDARALLEYGLTVDGTAPSAH